MRTIKIADCARCQTPVMKNYRLSRRRMARPIYCSTACEKLGRRERAVARRASYFWTKVARSDEKSCWPWLGYHDPQKYGRYGRLLAHRISYLITHGDIPEGGVICHSCDNPICVNPSHLWLGSQSDNIADMDAKERRIVSPLRGEKNNMAKLTAQEALHIFNSGESGPALATRFGITKTAVYLIKRGRNWAHVTGAQHAK